MQLFRREVEGFFKILDKNQDGKLSFEEFLGEETHIEKIFRTMDKDNDGFVTKEVSFLNYYSFVFIIRLRYAADTLGLPDT